MLRQRGVLAAASRYARCKQLHVACLTEQQARVGRAVLMCTVGCFLSRSSAVSKKCVLCLLAALLDLHVPGCGPPTLGPTVLALTP
jgi:hypothetical protein